MLQGFFQLLTRCNRTYSQIEFTSDSNTMANLRVSYGMQDHRNVFYVLLELIQ